MSSTGSLDQPSPNSKATASLLNLKLSFVFFLWCILDSSCFVPQVLDGVLFFSTCIKHLPADTRFRTVAPGLVVC